MYGDLSESILIINLFFRYLVLDIADNPVENIIRFFPMVGINILISLKIYDLDLLI